MSVAAPVMILSAGADADRRRGGSDQRRHGLGSRTRVGWRSRQLSCGGHALPKGLSVAVGSAVVVTAISTGWVLSAASQAIAFIPNEIGAALLYNERITR